MNLQTLERLVELAFKGRVDTGAKKVLDKAAVFKVGLPEVVETFREAAKEAFSDEGQLLLPFQCVKVIDTVKGVDGSDMAWIFFNYKGCAFIWHFIRGEKDGKFATLHVQTVVEIEELRKRGTATIKISEFGMKLIEPIEQILQGTQKNAATEIDHLLYFVSLVSCPNHFTVKVGPSASKRQGRSVQWVENKSHYIILDSGHAKQLRNGTRKDFGGEITRAMHRRRGHIRLLTHERYTRKKGMRIWVNATWVGPQSWQGNDGSIYIVQEKKLRNLVSDRR